jgi:plasmid stabilization system protein ParE
MGVVMLLAALGGLTLAARAAETAGKVELVSGQVRVMDAAQAERPVKAGDSVREGESIVTGADGEIHLEMADGGTIAVRPNTRLRIAEYRARGDDQDKGVFSLLAGGFRSITGWIGKFNPRSYQVRTPTATIGIRGTDHEPMVIPEGSGEGEAGTYDKVNAGATYIESEGTVVEVPEQRAAFAPLIGPGPRPVPRLLERIPPFFRPGLNEQLLERRHEAIQHLLERRRFERRQFLERHPLAGFGDGPVGRPSFAERRAQALQQRLAEKAERRQLPPRAGRHPPGPGEGARVLRPRGRPGASARHAAG